MAYTIYMFPEHREVRRFRNTNIYYYDASAVGAAEDELHIL